MTKMKRTKGWLAIAGLLALPAMWSGCASEIGGPQTGGGIENSASDPTKGGADASSDSDQIWCKCFTGIGDGNYDIVRCPGTTCACCVTNGYVRGVPKI